ncbi:head morphogenesis protein, partial [Riemerella anatipestifer]|nr:head morphogenesis protein [Riemerella anatipestifer]
MTAKEKMELAEKVHNLTTDGVDDDYFYEEFGLPRGRGKKVQPQTEESDTEEVEENEESGETEEPNKENKVGQPKHKTPKKKKVQAKEL